VAAVGNVAAWAHDTALDPDTYDETTEPIVGESELSVAVTEYLTDEVTERLAVNQLVRDGLPDELLAEAAVVEPVEAALRPFVSRLVVDALDREEVAELRETMDLAGDDLLVDVLQDDNELVSTDGDTLVLDVSPAIGAVDERLDPTGLAIGLPEDASRLSVYRVPELVDAADAIDTLDGLASALAISVPGLMILVAVVLVRRRLWLVGVAGLAIAGAALLVLAVEAITGGIVLDQVTEPIADLAGQSLWDAGGGKLIVRMLLLALAGCVLAAVGFGLDAFRRRRHGGGAPEPAQ
jgi:hypothetical protein